MEIPIGILNRSSVLDGLTLLEVVPIERLKALLKSDLLLMNWGDWDWENCDWFKYPNEKEQLQAYLKLFNKKIGGVQVKYAKTAKHKWGRAFPKGSLGLSSIRRECRNTLINGLYYDLDLSNAQPEIIRNLCESNKINCPFIKRYCNNRDEILESVQKFYGVDRDQAKGLFLRLCFSGSFYGWCKSNKIVDKPEMEFITCFQRELKDIITIIKKENPSLYETARKLKEDDKIGDNRSKDDKILGTMFGLYNQEYEHRIVEKVICHLINKTDLMKYGNSKIPVGAYEYDGIKLWKQNVDNYEGGLEAVINLLNTVTYELTGFKLKWSEKTLDDGYNIDKWLEEVKDDDKPNEELIKDTAEINKTISDGDAGIIELLMKEFPNHFIYSVDKSDGSRGDWFGWNSNRWEKSDAPLRKAIIYEVEKKWNSTMKKWDDLYEKGVDDEFDPNYQKYKKTKSLITDRVKQLKSASGIQNCVSVAKTLMANYNLEFDTNDDLFGCENGVIDITNELFRPYKFDDYITFSCGYNFTPNIVGMNIEEKGVIRKITESDISNEYRTTKAAISDIYTKIFPDEELRRYFFKIISTGMTGRAIEKFFIFNGAGRNGKGLTNEFLERVFGNYFVSVNPIIFSEDQKKKSSSGANPEIAKLDKKRYIVSKEPQKNAPFHNNIIKDLTGGGNTSARMLYSSKTNVKLCGTTVVECNDKPPFSEAPKDADILRMNDILFVANFTSDIEELDETTGKTNHIYKIDTGLKSKLNNCLVYRNTMLNILLENLIEVKQHNYDVDHFKPESVKKRSLEYLQKSYDIHNIFIKLFEKRCEENAAAYLNWKGESGKGDEDWSLTKIISVITKSAEFAELPRDKKKEYTKEAIEEFFLKNVMYKASVYYNSHSKAKCIKEWRLKPVEDEDDDYEE